MLKKLAILLGIFLFLGIITTAYAQTQITDCPDKCENSTLFLKGALDPKLKICVYGIREPCKYGCENTSKIPICKEFPDKPPTNATEYDETIWNMVKRMWNKEMVRSDISIQFSGTEYISGDNGTIFLQLLNSTNQAVNNALCYLKAYYPNKTILFNNVNMPYFIGSDGLYYYDFVVPNTEGVYMLSANCNFYNNLTYRQSSNDTYVNSAANTTNYGNLTYFYVGRNGAATFFYGYVFFNTSNITAGGIISAELYLYQQLGLVNRPVVTAQRVTSAWNEYNVTWNTKPTNDAYVWDRQEISQGWYKWNITELMKGWLNGSYANYGVFLNISPSSGTLNYTSPPSKESGGAYMPYLLIQYYSNEQVNEIRGSGEVHVSNALLDAINSVNQTLNSTILNYLIVINGTTYQINQSQYQNYISLLTAINSVNMTANQTLSYVVALNGSVFNFSITELSHFQQTIALLNDINYALNTTLEYKLDMINGTVNQINQSQNAYYLSLLGAVEGVGATLNGSITQYLVYINGTTHNLSVNEFNHYLSILEAINSVNYTANTTLENKLDYLNSTIIPLLYEINATTNTTLQLVAQINQTMLQNYLSLYNFLTTLENKLDLINSTVIQINDTVNNLNFTIDLSQVFAAISQVNSTVNQNQQYLISINGTAYQMNGTLASILQAIYDSNSSITSQLSTINGNILNLNSSEFQHYNDLYVILKDINFTTNTTLEYKLDLINYTTWQSWIMLQNLTIGNVSVTANVNWAEGVPIIWNASGQPQIDYNLLSLSDKGIQLTTETLTCLSNTTLQHMLNITNCIQGTCQNYNQTIVETCSWGCGNNQCIPAPQFQYMFAIGFALILIGVIYVGWRVAK